jgi:hypothetical protein
VQQSLASCDLQAASLLYFNLAETLIIPYDWSALQLLLLLPLLLACCPQVQGLDPQTAEPAAALAALQAQLSPQQQAEVDAEAQRLFAEVGLSACITQQLVAQLPAWLLHALRAVAASTALFRLNLQNIQLGVINMNCSWVWPSPTLDLVFICCCCCCCYCGWCCAAGAPSQGCSQLLRTHPPCLAQLK